MSCPHYKGTEDPAISSYIQDKYGNKELVTIKPKALDVTWGNDSRYWRLYDGTGGSAELVQVCWLEVSGSIDLKRLKANTDYKLQFRLQLKPDAFGWRQSPVYFMVKVGKTGKPIWRSVDLSQYSYGKTFDEPSSEHALKFSFDKEIRDEKLMFGLYEVWGGRWKGGMVIQEVIISRYH